MDVTTTRAKVGLARSAPSSARGRATTCRSASNKRAANFINLKQLFGREGAGKETNKVSSQPNGIFPVSEATADIIKEINSNDYVHDDARVKWSDEGCFVKVRDPKKEKLNNFEKTKMAKNPMLLTLDNFKEWAKIPFEELDTKENAGDIDVRLKWFGLFHRRKQQYGKFMMRLKLPNGIVTSDQLRTLAEITDAAGEEGELS